MELFNVLANVATYNLIDYPIELNFIGEFIRWLITITGSAGLGIILFTLVLKVIVLPFDIISKVKSKQNAVKMESMRKDLEKLQKQYANNKDLYNQKMMALQKKNGYSPLSGCLPMILSMVIFIVAINAFRMYSAYAMKEEYNDIVYHYNVAVKEYTIEDDAVKGYFVLEDDVINVKNEEVFKDVETLFAGTDYVGIKYILDNDANLIITGNAFSKDATKFLDLVKEKMPNETGLMLNKAEGSDFYTYSGNTDGLNQTFLEVLGNSFVNEIIIPKVNEEVKKDYESGDIAVSSFLWVKNIWLPDVSYEHPIPSTSEEFQTKLSSAATKSCNCSCEQTKIPVDSATYNAVTAGLYDQKNSANGYFIMIVLSIGSMFLSQFIMQKMQKSQLELQTVDSQAQMTQKMMMWMMPVMFGIFAFSYSTAFSIYMTISSVVSTLSSIIINVLVEKKYKKASVENTGRSKRNISQIEKERKEAEEKAKEKALKKQEKKNKNNKKEDAEEEVKK